MYIEYTFILYVYYIYNLSNNTHLKLILPNQIKNNIVKYSHTCWIEFSMWNLEITCTLCVYIYMSVLIKKLGKQK